MKLFLLFFISLSFLYPKENSTPPVLPITELTKSKFEKKYGLRALLRLKYLTTLINNIKGKTELQKLYEVNRIVNRLLHYADDKRLWDKNNYLPLPLETIGIGYGDTEDMGLLKKLILVRLGIEPKKLELVKKDIPFLDDRDKKRVKNIALGYFKDKKAPPLILDHRFTKGKRFYKYKEQFRYKIFIPSGAKEYSKLIGSGYTDKEIGKIFNTLGP